MMKTKTSSRSCLWVCCWYDVEAKRVSCDSKCAKELCPEDVIAVLVDERLIEG